MLLYINVYAYKHFYMPKFCMLRLICKTVRFLILCKINDRENMLKLKFIELNIKLNKIFN